MFKSKSKSVAAAGAGDSSSSTTTLGNGKKKSSSPSPTPPPPVSSSQEVSVNGSLQPLPLAEEVGKEAKEKKDRSSWVKTIGMRTLRMRRSTDSRSSRLSLPGFSSLDRPAKSKKSKEDKAKEKEIAAEPQYGNLTDSSKYVSSSSSNYPVLSIDEPGSSSEHHVNVPNTAVAAGDSSAGPSTFVSVNDDCTIKTKDSTSTSNTTSNTNAGESSDKHDPARFLGEGLTFRGKLIGVLEVSGPRGDRICQEALSDLKMAVKAAGEHKQKVTVHVALDGLRIRDEKTGDCLYHHQVHKISFIAQDLTDTRAFGYIFGSPDTGHRFFGIKTEKSASQVVIAMRDLFQVVFDFKKKEIEKAKQQLEMQQKFLATRAAEVTIPSSKPEPKFAIAETYIEGACAAGTSRPVPNRVAPEVDLLNLEVELTSLQQGLDSIHHNLSESVPFRGSTASISSDPMNPMPNNKRSSVSSSQSHNINNTTPIPTCSSTAAAGAVVGFGGGGGMSISDPFGDSFDPFSETSSGHHHQHSANFHLGVATADPFAQVDPFPSKYPGGGGGEGDFFNSDPFDSPSGPFSFSFPAPPSSDVASNASIASRKISESSLHRGSINGSPQPKIIPDNHINLSKGGGATSSTTSINKEKDGWTASFEDNFVPESDKKPSSERDVFMDLDPLGVRRLKSAIDRPSSSGFSSDLSPPNLRMSAHHSTKHQQQQQHPSKTDVEGNLTSSFSTNFNPATNNPPPYTENEFKTTSISSFNANKRAESPPNYSPPPPPRVGGSPNPASQSQQSRLSNNPNNNTQIVPHILPPSGSSCSPRLGKKKSPQILKQITISESSFSSTTSPKTLPHKMPSLRMGGKQFTLDSSFKDDIPNLSPPPRPPHAGQHHHHQQQQQHSSTGGGGTLKSGSASLTSAVPRPTSGSASEKSKNSNKSPGNVIGLGSSSNNSGLPPEPPPRPLQSSSSSLSNHPLQQQAHHHQNQLVSPPPPLPPKKQSLSNTLSTPLGYKQQQDKKPLATSFSSSRNESNDLPLPLPLRKMHSSSTSTAEQSSFNSSSSALHNHSSSSNNRYAVPESNLPLNNSGSSNFSSSPQNSQRSLSSDKPSNINLSMEQALSQVASLSLRDLAIKLELPVEKLSSYTIQQLAQKLTEMDLGGGNNLNKTKKTSGKSEHKSGGGDFSGFDDDFSTASAPPPRTTTTTVVTVTKDSHSSHSHSYDRYAVFRELALEDASGFSIENNVGSSFRASEDDEDEQSSNTLAGGELNNDKQFFTSRESSSDRTLQADDNDQELDLTELKSASFATAMGANTMDDVTDVNFSDDEGKFTLDNDDDDFGSGFVKNEWATFESNFDNDDQDFATTALVKAEDGNESPWDSEEDQMNNQQQQDIIPQPKLNKASPSPLHKNNNAIQTTTAAAASTTDHFDFKPFEKPPSLIPNEEQQQQSINIQQKPRKYSDEPPASSGRLKSTSSPERILNSPGVFQRQSSGSSRHSERSSGNAPQHTERGGGKISDYSDSPVGNKPERERTRRHHNQTHHHRRGSRDYERWDRDRDFDRSDRDGSGRSYRGERDFIRPDSRSSYTSIPRSSNKYNRDSDEEYNLNNSGSGSVRRIKSGGGGGTVERAAERGYRGDRRRSSKDYDRDGELVVPPNDNEEEEEDDRSYASNYSTSGGGGYSRRHHHTRRVPSSGSKYYSHHHSHRSSGRRDRERGGSPDRYSNHESDDESLEEGEIYNTSSRKRDRENYAREREYYERHHRPRPNSGSSSGKRYSPRHPYYTSRRERRAGGGGSGRYGKDASDDRGEGGGGGDSRELSEYSGGEDDGHSGRHHGSHRRVRAKRSSNYYRDGRDDPPPRSRYYENSPSWDSESPSNPEGDTNNLKEYDANMKKSSTATTPSTRRPNSGKDRDRDEPPMHRERQHSARGESPENYGGSTRRRMENKESSSRRYQSELALNSKSSQQDSPTNKLTAFDNFDDTFGSSSLPPLESSNSNKSRNASLSSPPVGHQENDLMIVESNAPSPPINEKEENNTDKKSHSPFGDDFIPPTTSSQNGVVEEPQIIDNLLIIDEPTEQDQQKIEIKDADNQHSAVIEADKDGESNQQENGLLLDSASSTADTFPPTSESKVFSYSGRRLESIKSEEEKSNDDNSHSQNSEGLVQMKKSDSFNIFKQRADDPFADDEFFT